MRAWVLIVSLGLLAACSPSEDTSATIPSSADLVATTTTSTEVTTTTVAQLGFEQATLQFTACMREEGVDLPDIRLDAQGRPVLGELLDAVDTSSVVFRGALASCSSILTQSGAIDLTTDPEIQAIILDQLQQFSTCMRDEGVTQFPDPVATFAGTGSPYPLEQIPFNDPAFAAAAGACQDIIGSLGVAG